MSGGNNWARTWDEWEDGVIRRAYPDGGADAVMHVLEGRSRHGIHSRASRLGVKRSGHVGGALPKQDFTGSPVQDGAADHRAWMRVDRSMRADSRPAVLGAAI